MSKMHVGALIGLAGVVWLDPVGAEVISPINGRALSIPDERPSYTFLLVGHLYGAAENHASVYPAASFLANLDLINHSGADFLVLLGDNYRSPEQV